MAKGHISPTELLLSRPEEVGKQTSTQLMKWSNTSNEGRQARRKKMSKQIVKTLTMLTLVVGLALAAAVVSANPQLTSHGVIADIPFDFIVADQTLPAGKYTVRAATADGDGLRISNLKGKASVMRLSNPVAENSEKRKARMVFHRYGQQYFLAEIWSGDGSGRQLNSCKRERHLRNELAANPSKKDSATEGYEIVEVAVVR
jgi:hypothetical protein